MKTKLLTVKFLPKLLAVMALTALSGIPRAIAVPVTFSGGSGAPLSFTLTDPVTYLVTANGALAPLFVFQNVGDLFSNSFPSVTGNITFTINAGSPQSIAEINSGVNGGAITANDVYFFGSLPGVSIGDTVILSSGTLTTSSNVAAAAPPGGMYNTFIIDGFLGLPLSGPGVSASVPDSFSTLWLSLPLTGMFAVAHLRRRNGFAFVRGRL
jgi:hypothetical protein